MNTFHWLYERTQNYIHKITLIVSINLKAIFQATIRRIIYFYYLFFHCRHTHKLCFLSCRPFVVNATFSTGLVVPTLIVSINLKEIFQSPIRIIIYFYYIFLHFRPTQKMCFLSCRPFVVNATLSTGLVVPNKKLDIVKHIIIFMCIPLTNQRNVKSFLVVKSKIITVLL